MWNWALYTVVWNNQWKILHSGPDFFCLFSWSFGRRFLDIFSFCLSVQSFCISTKIHKNVFFNQIRPADQTNWNPVGQIWLNIFFFASSIVRLLDSIPSTASIAGPITDHRLWSAEHIFLKSSKNFKNKLVRCRNCILYIDFSASNHSDTHFFVSKELFKKKKSICNLCVNNEITFTRNQSSINLLSYTKSIPFPYTHRLIYI